MKNFFSSDKKEPQLIAITFTTATFLKAVGLVIGTTILLAALHKATHALLLIFTAVFLALALNAPVHWFSRHLPGKLRGNRTYATALSFFLIIAVLAIFIASLVPPIVKQTESFISNAPSIVSSLRDENSSLGRFVQEHNLEGQVNKLSKELSDNLNDIGGHAFATISSFGSSVFAVLTVLVLTFMMLIEGPHWIRLMRSLIPPRHHRRADDLARNMYRVVKGFVNGQVTLAVIASVMLLPGLLALHIGYPIALVFVVFICGLIPMVGHTIGAVIVTAVALLTTSPTSAVLILLYYFLYQQIENYVIQPRIQSNSTDMSPLLVFASVVIGVSFSGLLGGLVAIPVAGCLRILALEYLGTRGMIHDNALRAEVQKVTDGPR
ncbi:MAG: family transporter [Candidatus Saccharibacteria bacterium]|nr:family transporter [Candidatus Saccharibacteria bacterium]